MDADNSTEAFTETATLQAEDYRCKAFIKLIMHAVIAGAVCILGFIGNSTSFAVLMRDKSTPVASFMLQSLAFIDNFFLCLWFLHFSLAEFFNFYGLGWNITWVYMRLYTYPLLFAGQTATIWMTVLIAVTRYIAVCKPYKAAKICSLQVVKRSVVAVFVCSLLYNVPRYFETTIIVETNGNSSGKLSFNRTLMGDSAVYKLLYFDVLYYIMCFALPLVGLAVLNIKLTLSYRRVLKRKRRLSIRNSQKENCDNNITLVLILVILSFMVCNFPARVVQIVWRYKPQTCMSAPFWLSEISNILEVLNSSVNFIIYCVFRKQFRDILAESLCFKKKGDIRKTSTRYSNVQTQFNANMDTGLSTALTESKPSCQSSFCEETQH